MAESENMALLIIGLYMDMNVALDSKSDYLLARLVGLLVGDELRAQSPIDSDIDCAYHGVLWVSVSFSIQ